MRETRVRIFSVALLALGVLCLAAGCTATPVDVLAVACSGSDVQPERCAKAIGETWEVSQIQAAEVVKDPATPATVKDTTKRLEKETREVVVPMLNAAAEYKEVKDALETGADQQAKLNIANAKLADWVARARPLIFQFRQAVSLKE